MYQLGEQVKKLWSVLLALLISSPSWGATYYISQPNGNDGAGGTTENSAWQTIGRANNTVIPGDIVFIGPGNYAAFPNPVNGGSAAGRIMFRGWHGNGDPIADTTLRAAIKIPGNSNINHSHFSVHGVTITSPFRFVIGGDRDSLIDFTYSGTDKLQVMYGCKYTHILRGKFPKAKTIGFGGNARDSGVSPTGDYRFFGGANNDTIYARGVSFTGVAVGDRATNNVRFSGYRVVKTVVDINTLVLSGNITAPTGTDTSGIVRFFPGATTGNTFQENSLPQLGVALNGTSDVDKAMFWTSGVDSCRFLYNQFFITANSTMTFDGPTHPRIHYGTNYSAFKYNRYVMNNLCTQNLYAGTCRDFARADTFSTDTLVIISTNGAGGFHWVLAGCGNTCGLPHGSVRDIVYDSLFVFNNTPSTVFESSDPINSVKFTNNVVVCPNAQTIHFESMRGKCYITHNTLVGDPDLGVASFQSGSIAGYTDSVFFKDNIVAASAFTPAPDWLPYPYSDDGGPCTSPSGGSFNFAIRFEPSMFDSTATTMARFRSDNNLYSYHGWRLKAGDRDIAHFDGPFYASPPGVKTYEHPQCFGVGNMPHWETVYNKDSLSLHNIVRFVDSSLVVDATKRTFTRFNPSLSRHSAAIDAASDGGDIGAVQYVDTPVIAVFPTEIVFPSPANIYNIYTNLFFVCNTAISSELLIDGDQVNLVTIRQAYSLGVGPAPPTNNPFTVNFTWSLQETDTQVPAGCSPVYTYLSSNMTSDLVSSKYVFANNKWLIGYINIKHNDPITSQLWIPVYVRP